MYFHGSIIKNAKNLEYVKINIIFAIDINTHLKNNQNNKYYVSYTIKILPWRGISLHY